jgi:hypothetical protein
MSASKRRKAVIAARSKRANEERPEVGPGEPVKSDRQRRRDIDRTLTQRKRVQS